MKFEICILCHSFQHRLCWDLSSLLSQKGNVDLVVNIASMAQNGDPTTEEVVAFFKSQGLQVKHVIIDDPDILGYRAYVRNKQVECLDNDTDLVLFSDCDMVYSKTFFKTLQGEIKDSLGQKAVFCVGRWSNDERFVNALIEKFEYPTIVPQETLELLAKISDRKMANVGAGYFQLVEKRFLQGCYIPYGTSKDKHMLNELCHMKSDIQFRKRIGKKIKLSLPVKQFHINHTNDLDVGHHLEKQR